MVYDVSITCRGPEGVRGFKTLRTTQKGSDELLKRFNDGTASGDLLAGIERTEDPAPQIDQPAEPPQS